jgi:hypothetical protein
MKALSKYVLVAVIAIVAYHSVVIRNDLNLNYHVEFLKYVQIGGSGNEINITAPTPQPTPQATQVKEEQTAPAPTAEVKPETNAVKEPAPLKTKNRGSIGSSRNQHADPWECDLDTDDDSMAEEARNIPTPSANPNVIHVSSDSIFKNTPAKQDQIKVTGYNTPSTGLTIKTNQTSTVYVNGQPYTGVTVTVNGQPFKKP